ncbi:hypothetical protein AXE80_10890 [Wenyingzhuangia fucanilytica]|uniref:Uncharacterized protein n=1 Tax=Wenyingzhuangia fucanilytica TaxID=1790137 RepID=A0A1B1Y7J3_9FLAO|nr:hypothetical protein [Wenyingzhuangia fucanilytica]ANW96750.1 hypothetical protein AXE80_10890 [Wenyingzhuangia fucanilytica]
MDISNRNQSIIEKRYIRSTLQRAGNRIATRQQQVLNKTKGIPKNLLQRRTITVTGVDTLSMEHLLTQRFIDMKRLSNVKNPLHAPIHNKIIMGEYQRVINELQFGLTEDVKNKIAGNLNIEI